MHQLLPLFMHATFLLYVCKRGCEEEQVPEYNPPRPSDFSPVREQSAAQNSSSWPPVLPSSMRRAVT